jgi:repressor LexA
MTSTITHRQSDVLAMIKRFIKANSWPPTRVEIAKAMNWASPNAAEEHLKALAKLGFIEIAPGVSRGIRVIEKKKRTTSATSA